MPSSNRLLENENGNGETSLLIPVKLSEWEGWTISLLNRETVPLSAEMLKPHKVKQKFFFHIKPALILNGHLTRYRFFLGETNKILGEMLHPFLHLEGEM